MQQTPLHDAHQRLNARLVPFGGWSMPLHYGSQLKEHQLVRNDAGVFDVSHMRAVDLDGPDATGFLRRLLANDVAKLNPGQALYSCMLNPNGGVIDDLIVYRRPSEGYRIVLNAATAASDLTWMQQQSSELTLTLRLRDDLALLAVQGPTACAKTLPQLPAALAATAATLAPFTAAEHGEWMVGRTGYTGEDGFELLLPATEVHLVWQRLLDAGIAPCGLGARDTLRLEAGLNLYGQDMDAQVTPLECGLGWTVAWKPEERQFIGREALLMQRRAGGHPRQVGLLLEGRGVLRAQQPLWLADQPLGVITSGGFAPTLQRSIALARINADADLSHCEVALREQRIPARIVKPPFVRHGQIQIQL